MNVLPAASIAAYSSPILPLLVPVGVSLAPTASSEQFGLMSTPAVLSFCCRRAGQREPCCSANRSTARESAARVMGTAGAGPRLSVTCAGLGPALAVSRLTRATRRSHGSLPQHVSHCPVRRAERVSQARHSGAAGRVLRGAPVSAVTPAQRGKTGSQRDCCAAHGAAQVCACNGAMTERCKSFPGRRSPACTQR